MQTAMGHSPFPDDVAEAYSRDIQKSGANGLSRCLLDICLSHLDSGHADSLVAVCDAAGWVKGLPFRVRHNLIWKYAHSGNSGPGVRDWEAMKDFAYT